jgi:hypothetical protein
MVAGFFGTWELCFFRLAQMHAVFFGCTRNSQIHKSNFPFFISVFYGIHLIGIHFLLLFAEKHPEADLGNHFKRYPKIIFHLHVH